VQVRPQGAPAPALPSIPVAMFRPPPRKMLLALPAPQSEEDKETLVVCGICFLPELQRRVEPAGRGFHDVHEKPVIEAKRKGKKGADSKEAEDDEGEDDSKWRKKHKSKEGGEKTKKGTVGSLKLSPQLEGTDLYALLEVSETATDEQIKKQYRKLSLQYHPDKVKARMQEEGISSPDKEAKGLSDADMLFVKIQECYEVLSDQARRRQYDSTLEFDDSVPEEVDEATGGFYETFLPVFNRNARWSTRRPVPELGDDSTSIDKVHKFYEWWFNFETWRDFSSHDEHNLDDAEFREEKRWMERQNQKVRKKYEQEERRRILHLAEVAERLDPRIRAEREEAEAKKREEKERRARLKQEEEDAKRQVQEEKRQKEEQEQAEREEKERLEKEQKKAGKQVLKTLRQRLKKSLQAKGTCDFSATETEDLTEWALSFEEAEPLEALCARLEALPSASKVAALVRAELVEWRRRTGAEKEKEDKLREETRRNEEQKVREAKEAAAAAATGAEWSTEELGVLAKGLQKFPGGYANRWGAIAQLLQSRGYHRQEGEVMAKTKELSDGASLRSMGSRLESTFQAPKAKAKAEPAAPAASAKAPEKAAEAAKPAADPAEWSAEQQAALESALQKFPATLDKNERWKLIAEEVPGKKKAECVERFKWIRAQVKK